MSEDGLDEVKAALRLLVATSVASPTKRQRALDDVFDSIANIEGTLPKAALKITFQIIFELVKVYKGPEFFSEVVALTDLLFERSTSEVVAIALSRLLVVAKMFSRYSRVDVAHPVLIKFLAVIASRASQMHQGKWHEAQPEEFSTMCEVLQQLSGPLSHETSPRATRTLRIVASMLIKFPEWTPALVAHGVANKAKVDVPYLSFLVRADSASSPRKGAPRPRGEVKAQVLAHSQPIIHFINEEFLKRKAPLSELELASFAPLLAVVPLDALVDGITIATKRQAEVALTHTAVILAATQSVLSDEALVPFAKTLSPFLISPKDVIRAEASKCMHSFITSTPSAELGALATHLVEMYAGKHGKVTQFETRESVLRAIQCFTDAPMPSSSKHTMLRDTVYALLPLFTKETHAGVRVLLLETLTALTAKHKGTLAENIPFIEQHWSTAPPELALLALATFQGDSILAVAPLLPLLKSTIEDAPKQELQSVGQMKGVVAASLYLQYAKADPPTMDELTDGASSCWAQLGGGKVFNARFVQAASDQFAVAAGALYCACIELFYSSAEAADTLFWASDVVELCVTHPSASARRDVCKLIRASTPVFSKFASLALLQALFAQMHDSAVAAAEFEELCLSSATNAFVNAAKAVCATSPTLSPEEKYEVAFSALPLLHHPHILRFKKTSLLRALGSTLVDDLDAFVGAYAQQLRDWVMDSLSACYDDPARSDEQESALNFVRAVCGWDAFAATRTAFIKEILAVLRAPELLTTTEKDYHILHTPDGELYDKSVLPKEEALRRNQKDYETKKWEREVEKELAKKKGKKQEIKLTKQQQEAIDKKLEEEKEVREAMRPLDRSARVATLILDSLLAGDATTLVADVPAFTTTLLRAAKMSGIAGIYASDAYCALGHVCHSYIPPAVQQSVSRCVLRLNGRKLPFPAEWEDEKLLTMASRVVRALFHLSHYKHQLDDVSLTYVFPVFQPILHLADVPLSTKEDMMVFLNDHSHHGASSLFSRHKYLSLLVDVVRNEPRIAHQAGVSIVDFCQHIATATDASDADSVIREVDVLLDAYYSESMPLRVAVLQSLLLLPRSTDTTALTVAWVSFHEKDEDVSSVGQKLWDSAQADIPADIFDELAEPLTMTFESIREASAGALHDALVQMPDHLGVVVETLLTKYRELLIDLTPIKDKFGNIVTEVVDPWEARAGVAMGIAAIAPLLSGPLASEILSFMLDVGLVDRNEDARKAVLEAGMTIVDNKGKEFVADILPIFEQFMNNQKGADVTRQGAIILLGATAAHLDPADVRVPSITDLLVSTLSIPSEPVQEAVAKCLPPLVSATKHRVPELVDGLMRNLMNMKRSYGERRGAAYGLAAIGKGSSVKALKDEGVMDSIVEEIQSKSPEKRESALMALELMAKILGRKFEPYVVKLISHLLTCFGDPKRDVRAAAKDCSKAIMKMLSGHGVKMVLPALLESLESDQWRTKQGSAEMLGAMAYCAPKQLSSCLPTVVPHLSEVLTDSHSKVQSAGKAALKKIRSVIRNPEIKGISADILDALHDPVTNTNKCLDALLHTSFVHMIDSPSLALIMPVLQRALKERGTETKKKAAQIIGNMYSLTDPKDLIPYLPNIVPGLKVALIDPVPEMRAVTAKAFGAMVKGMGEENFADLLPWMLSTLRSNAGSVDRAGAAQGLAEVVAALGVERLESMMDSFIEGTNNGSATVREGHLMLFVYMPITFGDDFRPFVARVVQPILRGLTDIEDSVRSTAMRAGQRIIHSYQHECINLMLPDLLKNVLHEDWRMRQSSILLMGDVLYLLAGTSGNKSTHTQNEDDSFGTESSRQALINGLGMDMRNQVLSAIYFSRQDQTLQVRNAAVHVWKVIVSHTMRTLREILPSLMPLVLSSLSHEDEFRKITAARTLGEFVRKLGERVLADVLPMLEKGLLSDEPAVREGVCIGLSEILRNLSDDQAENYMPSLLPSVQRALSDEDGSVRASAGLTFAGLHDRLGSVVIDKIIPPMLNAMYEDDSNSMNILDGLRSIISTKSKVVLPTLIPHLTESPINAFNAHALAKLVTVAGDAVVSHIAMILSRLLEDIALSDDAQSIEQAIAEILENLNEGSVREASAVLETMLETPSPVTQKAACMAVPAIAKVLQGDQEDVIEDLFAAVLPLTASIDPPVTHACFGAMEHLAAAIQTTHVEVMQRIKATIPTIPTDPMGSLPGLCIPRGVDPIMSVYLTALATDNYTVRGEVIVAVTELVERTPAGLYKAHARKVIGPLIRMFTGQLRIQKHVLFNCLCRLLDRLGALLASFAPQLQPICIKSLQDPLRPVRENAGLLLSRLLPSQREKRIDSVVKTLIADTQVSDSVAEGIYKTLFACINEGMGASMLDETKATLASHLEEQLAHDDEDVRTAAAEAYGSLVPFLPNAQDAAAANVFTGSLSEARSWFIDAGRCIAIGAMVEYCSDKVFEVCPKADVLGHLTAVLATTNTEVLFSASYAVAALIRLGSESGDSALVVEASNLLNTLLTEKGKDVIPTALGRFERQARLMRQKIDEVFSATVPVLLNCVRLNTSVAKERTVYILMALLGMSNASSVEAALSACAAHLTAPLAEELRRFHSKAMQPHIGEMIEPEPKYRMSSASFDF